MIHVRGLVISDIPDAWLTELVKIEHAATAYDEG
jgi:hypothetical protein